MPLFKGVGKFFAWIAAVAIKVSIRVFWGGTRAVDAHACGILEMRATFLFIGKPAAEP